MGSRCRQGFRSAFGARTNPQDLACCFLPQKLGWERERRLAVLRASRSIRPGSASFSQLVSNKGKPFAPDERMKKILTEAAGISDATARTIGYPNSAWQLPFVGGYKFQTEPGIMHLDGYNVCCAPLTGRRGKRPPGGRSSKRQ